jgi:hypothetical protein
MGGSTLRLPESLKQTSKRLAAPRGITMNHFFDRYRGKNINAVTDFCLL